MPVIFEIGNVGTLVHADTKTLASLRGALSFRARVGRAGSVILSMGEVVPGKQAVRFATGLMRFVIDQWAKPLGVEYALSDRRQVPLADPARSASTDWLRDYQQDAISAARKVPRGIFSHPTGTGKGEIVVKTLRWSMHAGADTQADHWLIKLHVFRLRYYRSWRCRN